MVEPVHGGRSMLSVALHTISLANLALWISKPNGLSFGAVITCKDDEVIEISNYSRMRRFKPHIDYFDQSVNHEDFVTACTVYQQLLVIDTDGSTWRAVYSLWTALRETDWATRFMQVWMGLEALFGPADGRELSFRISQRIALFLKNDMPAARKLFANVKESYQWRSKVVHGLHIAKLKPEDSRRLSLFAERLMWRVLLKELSDSHIMSIFESADRESFLDNLVFHR